jgi:hypothetical protein
VAPLASWSSRPPDTSRPSGVRVLCTAQHPPPCDVIMPTLPVHLSVGVNYTLDL